SADAAFASRSKRASAPLSRARCGARILMASSRSSCGSRARYTSPMPPSPSALIISYGPRRAPFVSGMGSWPTFLQWRWGPTPSARLRRRLAPARRGRRRSRLAERPDDVVCAKAGAGGERHAVGLFRCGFQLQRKGETIRRESILTLAVLDDTAPPQHRILIQHLAGRGI